MVQLDRAVIAALRNTLTPDAIAEAATIAAERIRRRREARPDEAKELRAQIAKLESEIAKLMQAILDGTTTAGRLNDAIADREKQIAGRRADLAQLDGATVTRMDGHRLRKQIESSAELKKLLELLDSPHTQILRQTLKRLLGGQKLEITLGDDGQWTVQGQTVIPGAILEAGSPCSQYAARSVGTIQNVTRLTSVRTDTI
jgi:septal ring factor EnvC (AmiA/AmiB activator)